MSWKNLFNPTRPSPNLFYMTSGPIPPNPSELLLSDKFKALVQNLKEEFDYVIMDTPPIGLIADAFLLRPYVDQMLVVVRQKVTQKGMLKNIEAMNQRGELKNAHLIFNDVQNGKGFYGYGGNYNKSKNYYHDEDDG